MRNGFLIVAGLFFITAPASQATGVSSGVDTTVGKKVAAPSETLASPKTAKYVEGRKVEGGLYVSIPYELAFSKNKDVCQSLLSVVNKDLAASPYVDYSNSEYFYPWEIVKTAHAVVPELKSWHEKYRPPIAKSVIDINNDGDQEYIYVATVRAPLPKQRLAIFKEAPQSQMRITTDPTDELSLFSDFVESELKSGNMIGEAAFYKPFRLIELPDYSVRNPLSFRGEVAAFFIYKHSGRNYLVADTLDYDPQSSYWYQKNPWLTLFSVSDKYQLTNTCILKRTQ